MYGLYVYQYLLLPRRSCFQAYVLVLEGGGGERYNAQIRFRRREGLQFPFRLCQFSQKLSLYQHWLIAVHPLVPPQNANAVQGKLQEQLKMANQILTLAELARKAETEQEKASAQMGQNTRDGFS